MLSIYSSILHLITNVYIRMYILVHHFSAEETEIEKNYMVSHTLISDGKRCESGEKRTKHIDNI